MGVLAAGWDSDMRLLPRLVHVDGIRDLAQVAAVPDGEAAASIDHDDVLAISFYLCNCSG